MQAIETTVQAIRATVKQSDLKAALSKVGHAVAGRSTLPILNNLMLTAAGDSLLLSATNLEIGLSVSIPARVEEAGATTIPAKLFESFIGSLGAGNVEIGPLPNNTEGVRVRSGTMQAHFRGMSAEEYPIFPDLEKATPILDIDAGVLRDMIHTTAIAYARGDIGSTRPIFSAILTHIQESQLTLVSADTFRLALYQKDVVVGMSSWPDMLVPGTTYETLAAVMPASGTVEMLVMGENQIVFRTPDMTLTSRLIEGTYAAYMAIIPQVFATRVVMPTEALRDVIKGTSLFAKNEIQSNTVKVAVTPGQDGLTPGVVTISAQSDEIGDSEGSVDATVDGPAVTILFNVRYLADALNTIDTPEVVLQLNSHTQPGHLAPLGRSDTLHILMPLYSRG